MYAQFKTKLEELKTGEEFQEDEFKKVVKEMMPLNTEQNNLLFKIKLKEAGLIACTTLQDTVDM